MLKTLFFLMIFTPIVLASERDNLIERTRALNQNKQFNDAITLYKQYLKDNGTDIEIKNMLANTYSWKKSYNQAFQIYNEIIKSNPNYLPAQLGKIRVLSWEKKYDKALKLLKNLPKQIKNDPQVLIQKARIYSWKGKINQSSYLYKKAYSLDKSAIDSLEGLSNNYRWTGENTKLRKLLKLLIKKNPAKLKYYTELIQVTRALKLFNESETVVKRALKLFPQDKSLISAERILNRNAQNEERFKQALIKDQMASKRNNISEIIKRGRLRSWENKSKNAIRLFKYALKKDPKNVDALLGLGNTYYFIGKWDLALKYFKKAKKILPHDPYVVGHVEKVEKLNSPYFKLQYLTTSNDDIEEAFDYTYRTQSKKYSFIYEQNINNKLALALDINKENFTSKYTYLDNDNYNIDANSASLLANYTFNDKTNGRIKVFHHQYEEKDKENNFNNLEQDENLTSGYIMMRRRLSFNYFSLSYAREYYLTSLDSQSKTLFYQSDYYAFNNYIELTSQFNFLMSGSKNKIKESNREVTQYLISPIYRPKFIENFTLTYELSFSNEKNFASYGTSTLELSYFLSPIDSLKLDFTSSASKLTGENIYAISSSLSTIYDITNKTTLESEIIHQFDMGDDSDKGLTFSLSLGRRF